MAHVYYHCGLIGDKIETGSLEYPIWSKGVILWRLNVDNERLQNRAHHTASRMANRIARVLGGEVQTMTKLHGYCSIGVGEITGYQILDTYYGSDFFMVQWFQSGENHAEASALDTWLTVQRYQLYLDIHKITGSEIHHDYGHEG